MITALPMPNRHCIGNCKTIKEETTKEHVEKRYKRNVNRTEDRYKYSWRKMEAAAQDTDG